MWIVIIAENMALSAENNNMLLSNVLQYKICYIKVFKLI